MRRIGITNIQVNVFFLSRTDIIKSVLRKVRTPYMYIVFMIMMYTQITKRKKGSLPPERRKKLLENKTLSFNTAKGY